MLCASAGRFLASNAQHRSQPPSASSVLQFTAPRTLTPKVDAGKFSHASPLSTSYTQTTYIPYTLKFKLTSIVGATVKSSNSKTSTTRSATATSTSTSASTPTTHRFSASPLLSQTHANNRINATRVGSGRSNNISSGRHSNTPRFGWRAQNFLSSSTQRTVIVQVSQQVRACVCACRYLDWSARARVLRTATSFVVSEWWACYLCINSVHLNFPGIFWPCSIWWFCHFFS